MIILHGLRELQSSGLLSNQGEKSIHFYFIMVPLIKKVLNHDPEAFQVQLRESPYHV